LPIPAPIEPIADAGSIDNSRSSTPVADPKPIPTPPGVLRLVNEKSLAKNSVLTSGSGSWSRVAVRYVRVVVVKATVIILMLLVLVLMLAEVDDPTPAYCVKKGFVKLLKYIAIILRMVGVYRDG